MVERILLQEFIASLSAWCSKVPDLTAALIVGSHARGQARPDSDIDVILITEQPNLLLSDSDWCANFGRVNRATKENWGLVQSWRVLYENKQEVEFGITTNEWLAEEELSATTGEIIRAGAMIVFDREVRLQAIFDRSRRR